MHTDNTIFAQSRLSWLDRLIYRWRRKMVQPYIHHSKIVCDLGCGEDAYFLKEIKNDVTQAYGFDLSVKQSSDSKIILKSADLNKPIDLSSSSVDTIFSLAVLEHLNEPFLHIKESYRLLRPGGTLLLTTPSPFAKPILDTLAFLNVINKESIQDHKHYFTREELIKLCKDAGFGEVKFTYFQIVCNQLIIARKK